MVALPTIIPHTLTETQKQINVNANVERAQTSTPQSIFLNNYMISIFSLVPVGGWFFIDIVLFKTGVVVASYNLPVYWIFTTPFGILEIAVYSFCLLQGTRILLFVWNRKQFKPWITITRTIALTLSISGLILLFSAIWEYIVIIR
jgi:hypothetical protein